jgi:hypothetical protein
MTEPSQVSEQNITQSVHLKRVVAHAATCHYHSEVHVTLRFSRKLIQLTALLISLTWTIAAQQKGDAAPAPFNENAYRIGERLTYDVDFSHFISAAHVELYVAARGRFFNREAIQLRAHVETTGVVNVALLALNNDYTTYVDPVTGLPFRSQQVVREADRASELSSEYNQPAGTDAIPSTLRTGEYPGTFDLIAALYRARAMPLTDGASYFITVRSANEEYHAEIKVSGKQLIKTNVGSFNTVATHVTVKGGHDYNLRVYFSDDERHVPVLIIAKHPAGEIRAQLAGSEIVPQTTGPSQRRTVVPAPRPTPTPPPEEGPKAPLDLPFKIGEQLNYQVFLGTAAQSVGSITLTVRSRGRFFNHDGLQIVASAQTTGSLARTFAVNDQVSSYVDPETLLPFRTELALSEGKHRAMRNYDVDQARGSVTINTQQKIDIPVGTHDLLSVLYALRTFDLSPQKKNAVSLLAVSKPRTLLIESKRREIIELGGQKIATLMLQLTVPDDPQSDRLQMRIWVGDDSRHLPLRLSAVTDMGPAHADLIVVPASGK